MEDNKFLENLINKNCQDCVYRENIEKPVLDLQKQLQQYKQENEQLKKDITKMNDVVGKFQTMAFGKDLVLTTCPECGKEYWINECKLVEELKDNIKQYKQQIDELKQWLENKKDYCIKEKDKEYIDSLGKEQLLGAYICCEQVLSKLKEHDKENL